MDYLNFEHLLLEKASVSASVKCTAIIPKSNKGPLGDAQLVAAHVHQDRTGWFLSRLNREHPTFPLFAKKKERKHILKKFFFCFFFCLFVFA